MEEKKYNRSFAGRLSRWVMLVLLVMMCGLSYLIYTSQRTYVVELSADGFHTNMESTVRFISDVMSDVSVAVGNNLFDVERHLGQPDQMQAIVERIVKQNPRIRSCGISFIDSYYPKKGRWFCPYAWRNDSMQVVTRQLGGEGYDYLDSEWFKEAVASDSVYWSKPFFDGQDAKTPLVAYMYPIHDAQGRLVAVLGADLSLDFMARVLEEQDSIFFEKAWAMQTKHTVFHSYVLSHDGTYITHPEQRRIQKGNFFVHIKDMDEPGLAEKIVGEMKDGKVSHEETDKVLIVNRKENYLFYAPVADTNWMLVVSCPTLAIDYFAMIIGIALIFVIAFVALIAALVTYITVKRTAKPLKLLADTADKVAQGHFDTTLPTIKHRDEICQLRDSFENMQQSLASYVEELKSTTAEKASIENELKIAHGIQMSMLPKTYPAFPNRDDIDLVGKVTPAKAVGGDLYDFCIREEKLFFCIGDVSGKGVPASLVMAVTRSLFRNIAAHTVEPHKMVKGINDMLCDNNETNMFVTLFVGVLDLVTGRLDYSNAGHNIPLLLADGEVNQLPCDPNIPAGVMEGWTFSSQQIQIEANATLFLYTDGLNEAEDISHQQFGMDRVFQTAKAVGGRPQELVEALSSAVRQFVGEAEQSDDLTMFAVQKK